MAALDVKIFLFRLAARCVRRCPTSVILRVAPLLLRGFERVAAKEPVAPAPRQKVERSLAARARCRAASYDPAARSRPRFGVLRMRRPAGQEQHFERRRNAPIGIAEAFGIDFAGAGEGFAAQETAAGGERVGL